MNILQLPELALLYLILLTRVGKSSTASAALVDENLS